MNHAIIDILGERYTVRGDAEINYISEVGKLVDERKRDLSKNISHKNIKRLAILTAINLADELLQEKILQSKRNPEEALARRTTELISLLDEGLMAASGLEQV